MRVRILFYFFVLIWIGLSIRIYYLCVKSNTYYKTLAKQNIIKKEWIVPVRGEILDRNKIPLAVNKIGFRVKIAPHLYPKKEKELNETIRFLVKNFDFLKKEKIYKKYLKKNSPYNHEFIEVVNFIEYEKLLPMYVKLNLNPLIKVEPTFKRYYPFKELASHVIGYVGRSSFQEAKKDIVAKIVGVCGKSGVEKYYNSYLEGKLGYKKVKVNAYNQKLEVIEEKPPKENQNLVLSIDIRLQKFIQTLFRKKAGAVIVMKTNGEIIAAGSFPEYDINMFVSGISKTKWIKLINDFNHPFTNKLINGLYPPGSIVKMGVALSFLDSRKINEYTSFFCDGDIELGRRKFRCWRKKGHKRVNLIKAIRESCDVYFYEGSLKIGINKIAKDLRRFGLGKKTGVDLIGEFSGIIPDKLWKEKRYGKKWYVGETVVTSIGQGYSLVTPMQIARYTAFLATGKLPIPHFAKKVGNQKYKEKFEEILSPFLKKKLRIIQKAMYEVCNHPRGTAFRHLNTKIKIAGKTGTAQVVGIPQDERKRMKEEELKYFSRSHAWLTTYGPYENPQFVITVLVEHGGHGGEVAGPIVSKIYNKLIEFGYI